MEVKQNLPLEKEIRKILVKCPPGYAAAFLTFPFLITLSEEFPKSEIFIITEEGCSLAYAYLPFKVRFFERPKEKLSLFQTHHFCANLHDVFNIDLYFDLENSFNSAFMGFNFRSVARVGFVNKFNKYFLTKKYVPQPGLDPETTGMKLLELYQEKGFQDIRIVRVRDEGAQVAPIEQLFKEPEPPKFIMVMLDNFQNVSKQVGMWTKFFDSFQNQKFIISSLQDEDLISELFASIDLGHNNLYMHKGHNHKEMIYLLNKVSGVVSNNFWAEGLCTYYASNAVTFLTDAPTELPHYRYFRMKPQRLFYAPEGKLKLNLEIEERELEQMNQVVDYLHHYFKL